MTLMLKEEEKPPSPTAAEALLLLPEAVPGAIVRAHKFSNSYYLTHSLNVLYAQIRDAPVSEFDNPVPIYSTVRSKTAGGSRSSRTRAMTICWEGATTQQ